MLVTFCVPCVLWKACRRDIKTLRSARYYWQLVAAVGLKIVWCRFFKRNSLTVDMDGIWNLFPLKLEGVFHYFGKLQWLVSCNGNSLCSLCGRNRIFTGVLSDELQAPAVLYTDKHEGFGLCVALLCKLTSLTNALLTSKLGNFYHLAWNTWRRFPDYADCMSPGNDA
jgi:hypothetical protein